MFQLTACALGDSSSPEWRARARASSCQALTAAQLWEGSLCRPCSTRLASSDCGNRITTLIFKFSFPKTCILQAKIKECTDVMTFRSNSKKFFFGLILFQCSHLIVFKIGFPFISQNLTFNRLVLLKCCKIILQWHCLLSYIAGLYRWTFPVLQCVWEVKGEGWRWRDSLVEGWGERGISVKICLIGHTVTADVHLVSAWRCCGKPDNGYTRIHNMRSSLTFQCKLTADTIKSIVYRPWCPWCPFWSLPMHLANLIMQ